MLTTTTMNKLADSPAFPIPKSSRDFKRWNEKFTKTDGCWLWKAATTDMGYGVFWMNGTNHYAHRISYALEHGFPLDGQWVLHRCDVKNCVNPAHLYQGDVSQNVKDAIDRGRLPRGESHWTKRKPAPIGQDVGNSKISNADRIAIHTLHSSGASCRSLSKQFGVHICTIYRIVQSVQNKSYSDALLSELAKTTSQSC